MFKVLLLTLSAGFIVTVSQAANTDVRSLPRIETSLSGQYPEDKDFDFGLELKINFGGLGLDSQRYYTRVASDRKLFVPDLSSLNSDSVKDLLPIYLEFSVPSPGITGSEYGRHYLRSLEFKSVQEYLEFFASPLHIFFRYEHKDPLTVTAKMMDGTSFASWYVANIPSKNCLFASFKFTSPQGSRSGDDYVTSLGSSGTSSRTVFFVFRADKDVNYTVKLFSSSNPYICSGEAGPSSDESHSKIITEKTYTLSPMSFPNLISISVQ